MPKCWLDPLNHVHIWQVSPLPSVTPVKYERRIQQVTIMLTILKTWKIMQLDEIGLVAYTPVMAK